MFVLCAFLFDMSCPLFVQWSCGQCCSPVDVSGNPVDFWIQRSSISDYLRFQGSRTVHVWLRMCMVLHDGNGFDASVSPHRIRVTYCPGIKGQARLKFPASSCCWQVKLSRHSDFPFSNLERFWSKNKTIQDLHTVSEPLYVLYWKKSQQYSSGSKLWYRWWPLKAF